MYRRNHPNILHPLVSPNDKDKLPGPPARTLKLAKPGWRPRSASAVGSAAPPSAAGRRAGQALSEVEIVPVQIPDRVFAQSVRLVLRYLNDFDAVGAVEL